MKTNKPTVVMFRDGFCLIFWSNTLKFVKELVDEVRKSTESYSVHGLRIHHYDGFIRPLRLNPFDIVDFSGV